MGTPLAAHLAKLPTPGLDDGEPGLEGFKQSLARFRAAFPDLRVTLEDQISVGDKVVVRWTDRGTRRGEFLGMAPTGKRVTTTGITIFRMAGGKVVEQWTNRVRIELGRMEQDVRLRIRD